MGLSEQLISQFVKATNDDKKTTSKETTVYGTTVNYNGKTYVKLDGSELLTPVKTTASVSEGDKVTVVISNHSATITGNVSDPSASSSTVDKQGSKIAEFEIVMAYKVTTDDLEAVNAAIENLSAITARLENATIVNAEIEKLEAEFADLEYVNANNIEAIKATIGSIEAIFGEFKDISTEDLEAINAEITNLKSYTADFTYVSADVLDAMKANINDLTVEKLDVRWGNIDIANINEATINALFVQAGIMDRFVAEDGHVTRKLVAVTIDGDLIQAGTIKADRLIVKGSDGNYYALSTDFDKLASVTPVEEDKIHGSVMVANSITAEKIVASDITSFGATIAGFRIEGKEGEKPGSIRSVDKDSVDSPEKGIYLDTDGQIAFGDGVNFLKFYKDENNIYRIGLSAESIRFGVGQDFLLNNDGMTVEGTSDNSNAKIKTNISNNGMRVYADNEEKLKADDDGVEAVDLHAKTYLIISGKSRLEKYGENRIGCFWIGD